MFDAPLTDFFGTDRNDIFHRIMNFGRVFGGKGNDTLTLAATAVHGDAYGEINGGDGNDKITLAVTTSAVDAIATAVVDGGAGNDKISANVVSDAASADGGFDGGDGNDTISVTLHAALDATGSILGGNGNDALSLMMTSDGGFLDGWLSGGAGNDALSLWITSSRGSVFWGGIRGGQGNDSISVVVSDGDSEGILDSQLILKVAGDEGNDTITVRVAGYGFEDTASVFAYGGEGNDAISARLPVGGFGGAIGANLFGDAGNDLLKVTGGGLNYLSGGDGNDRLIGSDFAQLYLVGGTGADRFVIDYGTPEGDARTIEILDFKPDTTLTFDDLVVDPGTGDAEIGDGYGGFDWNGAFVFDVPQFETIQPGNGYRAVSPSNAVRDGGSVTIERAEDFDFLSGWFSAAFKDDLKVTVDAYDDGNLVNSQDIVLDFGDAAKFTFDFASMDKIVFIVDPSNTPASNESFSFDNLTFRLDGNEGDLIRLKGATPADVQTLIATADQEGSNTVLTLPDATLTLQNFSAGDLLTDMFVV